MLTALHLPNIVENVKIISADHFTFPNTQIGIKNKTNIGKVRESKRSSKLKLIMPTCNPAQLKEANLSKLNNNVTFKGSIYILYIRNYKHQWLQETDEYNLGLAYATTAVNSR